MAYSETACDDPRCPVCYPKRKEEEKAARKKAETDKEDCLRCWRNLQKEAERIVSNANPIVRNRRINAAYAQLWLEDRRFQWAGLAAFASKQVGCGLLNSAELIQKSNQQRDAYQRWEQNASALDRMSPYGSPRMPMQDQIMGEGAQKVYQMLALGNTALFLEIWPLHKFYEAFGLARLKRCYPLRQSIGDEVYWPLRKKIEFGREWSEVVDAFTAIDSGNISQGVRLMARHEQINILQTAIYSDPMFATLMRGNQFAWALSIPTGSAREIQLTLANQCTVTGASAQREPFSRLPLANLADPGQRMNFVMRAADRFDRLLHDPLLKHDVENSLYLIGGPR
ncbi:hypothetical protein AWB77_06559 [Caballeronia fortuita]|uniref:Uncharacterized protein n=1 Tax=Caballeronia fortuita TaxID=1777138 RepID=A0A158E6W8_9BURK|nr:hypothetical protein [Caballeronia fortuita]SAL02460.1 hypothetical protein AWB77_06559 [Caballeronia fortuita]